MTWCKLVEDSCSRKASTDLSSMLLCLPSFVYCRDIHKTDDFMIQKREISYLSSVCGSFFLSFFFFAGPSTEQLQPSCSIVYLYNYCNMFCIGTGFPGILLSSPIVYRILGGSVPAPWTISYLSTQAATINSVLLTGLATYHIAKHNLGLPASFSSGR